MFIYLMKQHFYYIFHRNIVFKFDLVIFYILKSVYDYIRMKTFRKYYIILFLLWTCIIVSNGKCVKFQWISDNLQISPESPNIENYQVDANCYQFDLLFKCIRKHKYYMKWKYTFSRRINMKILSKFLKYNQWII